MSHRFLDHTPARIVVQSKNAIGMDRVGIAEVAVLQQMLIAVDHGTHLTSLDYTKSYFHELRLGGGNGLSQGKDKRRSAVVS